MQDPMTTQPVVPEWSFAPSWGNPRVRRLVAAVAATLAIYFALLIPLFHVLFGWSLRYATLIILVAAIVSLTVSVATGGPLRRRLVINPFGLSYATGRTYSVRATWADVASVGRYRWFLHPAEEGVFLGKGAQMSSPFLRPFGRYGRFVPLTLFDPDWRAGEIGGLIRCYAPWLLDTSVGQSGPDR